jgi:hypothetical protein
MTTEEKLAEALALLSEASEHMTDKETVPNANWNKRLFLLDGSHMILTEDGWDVGSNRDAYRDDQILDEVNNVLNNPRCE